MSTHNLGFYGESEALILSTHDIGVYGKTRKVRIITKYPSLTSPLIIVLQSTLVISNSKGLSEILRDIHTWTYQICRIEEKNKSNNHI